MFSNVSFQKQLNIIVIFIIFFYFLSKNGVSALQLLAAQKGHVDVIASLFLYGATVDMKYNVSFI